MTDEEIEAKVKFMEARVHGMAMILGGMAHVWAIEQPVAVAAMIGMMESGEGLSSASPEARAFARTLLPKDKPPKPRWFSYFKP